MRNWLLVFLLLAVAALVRIDFLVSINARLDSDEAIVGLMAKHILEGRELPIFYYGQHYMGSLEPILVAIGFNFFGINSWVVQSVPLIASLLFLWLLYLLALELTNRRAAVLTLIFGSFGSAVLIVWSTKARGGFIELMCIGVAALLTAVYWSKFPKRRPEYSVLTGLLLGLGWWVNNQIIYYMLPIVVIGLATWRTQRLSFKQVIRFALVGLAAFFLGGAPYWYHNIINGFPSLGMFKVADGKAIALHFLGVIDTSIPMLLGAKRFWHQEELFPGAVLVAWLIIAICLVTLWRARKQQLLALCKGRLDCQQPFEILLVFLLGTFAVFCVSSFGYLVQAPRYLLPAYTGILVLLGFTVDYHWQRKNYILAGAVLVCTLWLNWASSFLGGRTVPGEPYVFKQQRVSKDHTDLIKWLHANQYTWVRTNYWIGYRLAFETHEQVKFIVFGEPHETRIDEYQSAGLSYGKERMPLVLVPAQASYVTTALYAQGYNFQQANLSGYVVVYNIEPAERNLKLISADELEVRVSDRPEYAELAVDQALDTRWRSARPQSSGMTFEVSFRNPQRLRGLRYDTGLWPHDYPRLLGIELQLADGSTQLLYDPSAYDAIRYYLHGDSTLMFYFDKSNITKIRLVQLGSHPVFDWSIAELSFYE